MFHFGQFSDAYFPIIDGGVMVVKHYAEILNNKFGTCCVVAPGVPDYEDTDPFEIIRVKSVPIPQRAPYRYAVPQLHKSSVERIKACKFDLIHTHSPFGISQYGLKIARKRGIPVVSTFHSKYYDDFKQVLKLDTFAQIGVSHIVDYYRQVDQVWTVNQSTAQTLKDYGYKGTVDVIPNGSDTQYPENPNLREEQVRARYQLPEHVPVFLFVGQHIWQKNIKTLIQSMAYLKKMQFPFQMMMVGKGYASEDIARMVKEQGLSEHFIFAGEIRDREELADIYLTADLFLFPSLYDNAPLVVKEAAGMKTPAMVIAGSNAAEGIIDGENGFLITNDPEAIGNRILAIYQTEGALQKAGEQAERTLPISWDTIVEDVYRRYVELIKYKNRTR